MSGSCQGATSPGTVTQLQIEGGADWYLNQGACDTLFHRKYVKVYKFASEPIQQTFTGGSIAYGGDATVTFSRTGDLLHHQYIVIDVPPLNAIATTTTTGGASTSFPFCSACDPPADGLPPFNTCGLVSSLPEDDAFDFLDDSDSCAGVQGPWAHYVNAFAQFFVPKVCFVVGSFVIDSIYSEFSFAWEELSGKSGKLLTEMIGKRYTRMQLIEDAQFPQRFYLPLYFFYTADMGNTFPAVSAIFMQYGLTCCFADLQRMIQVSGPGLQVNRADTCAPITSQDVKVHVDSSYFFLCERERMKFARGCFELLIDQVQTYVHSFKNKSITCRLNFNNPLTEFIWMFRRVKNEKCNNWSNFSGKYGRDPNKHVSLRINNGARFSHRPANYFRLVQPYQHHTRIPNSHIYCFCFAEKPQKFQPTGTLNASRLESIEFHFEMQDALEDEEIKAFIFGRSKNILSLKKGLASLRFQV